ncbi:MAG: hypothetical protein A2527_06350 [Candidatus Lambdaproteobacteria bacterium RIFOXYD2_FULL_50_16]|uniref:Guanylate cyclase domain-containing protein n=1 Tax=Candidatus Lambdaproteobacteria bacterium RIFOXYD2_FULL_50_16 TaxID=1817772 RepID=A0A1F6GA19_9PROT|nr:MAG: hypothetical protein A2527_06350 [Candidatus Lambdaproteobacteria bacterium RIFOXYD2_FULL_50_16]
MSEPIHSSAPSLNNLPIVFKQMLALVLLAGCLTLVMFLFFRPELASSRFEDLIHQGKAYTVMTEQMALASLDNRQPKQLADSLEVLGKELVVKAKDLVQISVILLPSGGYYASTRSDLVGATAHPSLMEQLEAAGEEGVQVTQIPYSSEGQVLPVYQFLKAITVTKDDQVIKVGYVQVVIGYNSILAQSGASIVIHGLWITALGLLLLWFFHLPFASAHNRLTLAMAQVGSRKYDQELDSPYQDEVGKLFQAFNQMTYNLKTLQAEQNRQPIKTTKAPETVNQGLDFSLRKADLTCLCARVPGIQDWIGRENPDKIANLLQEHLVPFERQVKDLGGQVVKVIGDKIFTLFEGMNGVNNALRAAVSINRGWIELNHQRKVLGQKQLDYGIGVHSTLGLAGTLGPQVGAYTFVGASAAVAEYLCSCAEREAVLVTASTLERASVGFGQQQAKGLKSRSLSENEEIFSIVDLPAEKGVSESRERLTELKADFKGGFESMVPDMLEETLRSAPLDLNIGDEAPVSSPGDTGAGTNLWRGYDGQNPDPKKPEE